MTPEITTFLYGCCGSLGVEVFNILAFIEKGKTLPKRYSSKLYYCLRFIVMAIAGQLAVANGIYNRPILAISIGASAPLIWNAILKAHIVRRRGGSEF